ncbi:MAG: sulfurtransferase [Bacteroidetes bacterium]|nr:MAG: sulfurtransferase [Bacteroidota bacterium]
MGPLIPNGFIEEGWAYAIAVVLGFFFGMILEASGFSTSRKLVGSFYGYDFTVVRVFFTASVTAMVGLLYFNYMGWVDISRLYVMPTYFWPILTGGVIMGLGFVLGGFCPGTSMCAAAIGKIDAIVFVIGSFAGILIFSEAFPLIEDFYYSSNMGRLRIHESMGISSGLFAFLFTMIALIVFVVATFIMRRVKKVEY